MELAVCRFLLISRQGRETEGVEQAMRRGLSGHLAGLNSHHPVRQDRSHRAGRPVHLRFRYGKGCREERNKAHWRV